MRSLLVVLATMACVSAGPYTCRVERTPVAGLFSTSGVYALARATCPGFPPGQLASNLSFVAATEYNSDGTLITDETTSDQSFVSMGLAFNIFVLVDGSGSQVKYLQSIADTVSKGINLGLQTNSSVYANVTIAVAYFDGADGYHLIQDWSKPDSALEALNNKFKDGKYTPTDSASNLYGAYASAAAYVDKKNNATYSGGQYPVGLIVLTGDMRDTAASYYDLSAVPVRTTWTMTNFLVSAGNPATSRDLGVLGQNIPSANQLLWNTTNPAMNLSSVFNQSASNFAVQNQGLIMVRHCSSFRPVSYPYNLLLEKPNEHTVTFQFNNGYYNGAPASAGAVSWTFNATDFKKGCNLNSASTTSLSAVLLTVLVLTVSLF